VAFQFPVSLHFPAFQKTALQAALDRFVDAFKRQYKLSSSLREIASEAVFEKYSAEWIDTIPLDRDYTSAGAVLQRGQWLRLALPLRLSAGTYSAELIAFPLLDDPETAGLQLNFDGRAYAAIYEFQPRVEGGFDERAKNDFVAICYLAAQAAAADAFILLPDEDGKLLSVATDDIVERLRHPQRELRGRRAGLITGLKEDLVPADELRQLWKLPTNDPQVITTTSGYTVLDLIQPMVDG